MSKFFEGLAAFFVVSVLSCAAVVVVTKPAPAPTVVVQVDEKLEAVHTYVASKLRGVKGRALPAHRTRAIADAIVRTARGAGFDPLFVMAIIEVESRWDVDAVSPSGARGLMQLLPSTFAEVSDSYTAADPVVNIYAGVAYMSVLFKGGKGFVRPESLLRAYNGGPGVAVQYGIVAKAKGDLSVFSPEVRVYPTSVMSCYRRLVQAHGGDYKHPEKTWRMS